MAKVLKSLSEGFVFDCAFDQGTLFKIAPINSDEKLAVLVFKRAKIVTFCISLRLLENHVNGTREYGVLSHLHVNFPSRLFP